MDTHESWLRWVMQYGNMGPVKTTIEITDALLEEAKRVASRESMTLREMMEEGLRRSLDERKRRKTFRLRRASFRGKGMQPGVSEEWERIREAAYEGRGS
jgi:hypothetical protein